MWGIPCEMDAIMNVLSESRAELVEDCSHAHFTQYRGRLTGTFGKASCFSVGAKKTMTSGEGGFLLTSDAEVFLRATLLGHFGLRAEQALERVRLNGCPEIANRYAGNTIGFGENYRMHPYSAVMALSLIQSGEVFELISKRRSSLQYFYGVLRGIPGIEPPAITEDYYSGAMYGFKAVISIAQTKEHLTAIIRELCNRNVTVKLPDTGPLHCEPSFVKQSDALFPGAEAYLRGRVSFPTFSRGVPLDKQIIDEYGDVLYDVLNNF
jgi:dTDP-4-amino-4,6-dideoxygalactose transaminase